MIAPGVAAEATRGRVDDDVESDDAALDDERH